MEQKQTKSWAFKFSSQYPMYSIMVWGQRSQELNQVKLEAIGIAPADMSHGSHGTTMLVDPRSRHQVEDI